MNLNILNTTWLMIRYNLKIIFGNKFFYFLLAAVLIFLIIVVINLSTGGSFEIEDAYSVLTLSGALVLFYPLTFGIQSDKDARTLEIIFGIPDYRYRVWFMRNLLIYGIVFLVITGLALLLKASLLNFEILPLAFQVLFPLLFLGMLAFFISTLTKSGNATAVIIILIGLVFLMFGDAINLGYWNIFLNPFDVPSRGSITAFNSLVFKNRIFLTAGAVIFLLGGLMQLQQREKFLG